MSAGPKGWEVAGGGVAGCERRAASGERRAAGWQVAGGLSVVGAAGGRVSSLEGDQGSAGGRGGDQDQFAVSELGAYEIAGFDDGVRGGRAAAEYLDPGDRASLEDFADAECAGEAFDTREADRSPELSGCGPGGGRFEFRGRLEGVRGEQADRDVRERFAHQVCAGEDRRRRKRLDPVIGLGERGVSEADPDDPRRPGL
ncbi:hypothetical protein Q0Z83_075730 [Actinoplanes sichuanensis]|nr:hypothetical protein Q0Z83_075730 [Actinoplanes sichuanensis]